MSQVFARMRRSKPLIVKIIIVFYFIFLYQEKNGDHCTEIVILSGLWAHEQEKLNLNSSNRVTA